MSALNQLNQIGNNTNNMFRATKLWNEVLHSFFIGINPKKHRKHMKTYYNCFVASEAVDWLLNYLQLSEHFSEQHISRFQAINLLRKYLKTDIIERVDTKKGNEEFQDNKDLYQFTRHANENLPFISSTNLKQVIDSTPKSTKSDKQISNLLNELNLNEKSETYKQIFFNKIIEFIPNIDDFVRRDDIISLILMHNMTRISSNGVVQLTDKSQDLPHWVMSAMKCLANWPKASGSGSCLPKYPGFENDVFAVIRDYFCNIGIPLIPNQLYSLIVHIYDMFSNQTISSNIPIYHKLCGNPHSSTTPVLTGVNQINRQNSGSNENLLKTSTPILESQNPKKREQQLPPNHVFETVFMGDTPVTKIVSIDELTNLFTYNPRLKKTHSFRNNSIDKSQTNKDNTRYVDAITTIPRSQRRLANTFKSPIVDNIYKTKYESPDSSTSSGGSGVCYHNFGFAMQSPGEDGEYMLSKSVSSLSSINLSTNKRNDSKDNLSAQFSKSSNDLTNNCKSKTILKSEDKLLKVLQMSLFLIPSSNRRHLHLLLRLLSKIIENKEIKFNLQKEIEVKDYILKTFTRSILCADKEIAYNEIKAQKIVSILLDNCKDIFKVPIDLKEEIDRFLVQKAKQKIFDKNNECQQFCQQISNEEFELQRDVLSEYALADLLKSIMTDDRLTDRDKLKWIKQFKSYHPEVYDLYFTNQIKVEQNFKQKTNSKNKVRSQNSNLFKRFLSIRL